MTYIVVIPARLKSTRLPEKVLADIAGAPPATELAGEFLDFLGAGPVVALDGTAAAAWLEHLAGSRPSPAVLGLDEGAALLLPGRDDVVPDAVEGPRGLQRALAGVIGEFLASVPAEDQLAVRFEQRDSHFPQRFADSILGQAAFAAEVACGFGKPACEVLEHGADFNPSSGA